VKAVRFGVQRNPIGGAQIGKKFRKLLFSIDHAGS
jgi:hypothetical protein